MNRKRMIWRILLGLGIVITILFAVLYISVGKSPTCYFPSTNSLKSGFLTREVQSNGIERCYMIYVPESYDANQPQPVVFSLHGLAASAYGFQVMTDWNGVADENGFLVVYPHGSSFPLRWNTSPLFRIEEIDDVRFIEDILVDLQRITKIDASRVYVNGFSQGATLTEMVVCGMADQLAAIAMVEGRDDASRLTCDPSRPVPIMTINGTVDSIGEPKDYPLWFYDLLNITYDPVIIENEEMPGDVWLELWLENNECDPDSVIEQQSGEIRFVHYDNCAEDTEIQLYWLEGAGHTWPSGNTLAVFGETSEALEGTEAIWAFFESHTLPDEYLQE